MLQSNQWRMKWDRGLCIFLVHEIKSFHKITKIWPVALRILTRRECAHLLHSSMVPCHIMRFSLTISEHIYYLTRKEIHVDSKEGHKLVELSEWAYSFFITHFWCFNLSPKSMCDWQLIQHKALFIDWGQILQIKKI